jgi:hypothetical protein
MNSQDLYQEFNMKSDEVGRDKHVQVKSETKVFFNTGKRHRNLVYGYIFFSLS